jgi:hypothetical protein
MIRRSFETQGLELDHIEPGEGDQERVVFRYGEEEIEIPAGTGNAAVPGTAKGWVPRLRGNLTWIVTEARAAGVAVVLLTYPAESRSYRGANVVIREIARETNATLIDLGRAFRGVCAAGTCPEWFFWDQHPTAKGHHLAASIIRDSLRGGN